MQTIDACARIRRRAALTLVDKQRRRPLRLRDKPRAINAALMRRCQTTTKIIYTFAVGGFIRSQNVTGPSLVSDTFMSAPKRPVATR